MRRAPWGRLWVPAEPQVLQGVLVAAPFVLAIGAGLGQERQRRNPNMGNSGIRPGKNRKKLLCLLWGLCVTYRHEPEGSSFHWQWQQEVIWTSSALELSPCVPSSHLAAKEAAAMVGPKDPWLCEVPQVQRLSRANDTEGAEQTQNSPPETTKQGKC